MLTNRLQDEAKLVRKAAVDLVGTHVTNKPSLIEKYFRPIMERTKVLCSFVFWTWRCIS